MQRRFSVGKEGRIVIYVLRPQNSTGAKELAAALDGRRLRKDDRGFFRFRLGKRVPVTPTNGDTIVCWGAPLPEIRGVRLINNAPLQNKLQDAIRLKEAGVSTVDVSLTRPAAAATMVPQTDPAQAAFINAREFAEEFTNLTFPGGRPGPLAVGVGELKQRVDALYAALRVAPPAPARVTGAIDGTWVARTNNHVGGADLLDPPRNPDFYVKKIELVREYRIHSFLEKSIRAGVKAVREGFANPSTWVRSYDGGWRIVYDGFESKKRQRLLAHQAVTALGLQFGAVDIGEKTDGSLVVLEVNRAPGLEGGTVEAYAAAIQRWITGA